MIICKRIPIFCVDVWLVTSMEEAKAHIREHGTVEGEEAEIENLRGVCYSLKTKAHEHRLMCVFDNDRNTAIHEAVHMARLTLKHCSVHYTVAQDEALAYMTAWLADEMLALLEAPANR